MSRIERKGGPPDLPTIFEHFVIHELRGRVLDDNFVEEAKLGRFPDFACFRDLVLIKMKHLEDEQEERVNDIVDRFVKPEEQPYFFGKRTVNLSQFSNGKEIVRAIQSKLSRTIEHHLRSANSQFAAYRERNPRKNSLSICLIVNSHIAEFSPDLVGRAIQSKMNTQERTYRFPDIDLVIYISEKHAQPLRDGRAGFSIVHVVGEPAIYARWKIEVVEEIVHRWTVFRSGGQPSFFDGPL